MKKLLITFILIFSLAACDLNTDNPLGYAVGETEAFKLYKADSDETDCKTQLLFDDDFTYSLPCNYNEYFTIVDVDDNEFTVDAAVQYGIITVSDFMELFDTELIIEEVLYKYEDTRLNYLTNETELLALTGEVYVYSYLPTCGHCKSIKAEILPFIIEGNHNLTIYIVDRSNYSYEGSSVLGDSVPIMTLLTDGVVTEQFIGTDDIRDFIEDNAK